MEKITGTALVLGSIIVAVVVSFIGINAYVSFNREIGSNWDLAVKASTIEQKKEYIDRYVAAFENKGFEGEHDAWFFPTPSNSFDENYKALKSLQTRLNEIKDMDPNSFEYQTAIQQITGQEMDEAGSMTSVLTNVWLKENASFVYYGWVFFLLVGAIIAFFIGIALLSF